MKASREWVPSEEDKIAAEALFAATKQAKHKDPYFTESRKRYGFTYTCAKFFVLKHLQNIVWSNHGDDMLQTIAMVFEVYVRRIEALGIAKNVIPLDVCNRFWGARLILSTCLNNLKVRVKGANSSESTADSVQEETSNSVSSRRMSNLCINDLPYNDLRTFLLAPLAPLAPLVPLVLLDLLASRTTLAKVRIIKKMVHLYLQLPATNIWDLKNLPLTKILKVRPGRLW